ncbi:TetR/AcrR family transcriptional regulator [Dyella nitratireducens]|uniref:TetR family transcriptional regulator n=1 Tax=Dyella nitratireducens TaxID=1849580 RepID=A0ABQ1GI47_9GAMM|nr:TetR/AcrR family transcriptional regulator [Dyella nitratireducens]GGA44267.1 TetR family transcriptional regulator [Dyella nitratireducens]GLQ41766.1 TetR family transcriptional regulator [Dyella nitratireducens]
MDNPSRSERTRQAVIQAALAIIARDGPGKLTFDAIARESGLSKGGVMHQFPTKVDVLKALLEHQIRYFDDAPPARASKSGAENALTEQIARLREVSHQPYSIAHAIVAALVEEPELLALSRETSARNAERIKAEADDAELALLRWMAGQGLLLSAMFGMSPFSEAERERLFRRLMDDEKWTSMANAKQRSVKPRAARSSAGRKSGKS